MGTLLGIALATGAATTAGAEWARTRIAIHVGKGPSATAPVVGYFQRGDEIEVLEERRGWGRISRYVPAKEEGLKGRAKVARWIQLRNVTTERPAPIPKAPCSDPRIDEKALPKVGAGGLSEEEGALLCKGIFHFLESGQCARVEFGDVSKPGTFFINCGGKNIYFTAGDLE